MSFRHCHLCGCAGYLAPRRHPRGCPTCRKQPTAYHVRARIEALLAAKVDDERSRRRLARLMRLNWRLPYRNVLAMQPVVPTNDPRRDDPGSQKRMRMLVRETGHACDECGEVPGVRADVRSLSVTRVGIGGRACWTHWGKLRRRVFRKLRKRFPQTTYTETGQGGMR